MDDPSVRADPPGVMAGRPTSGGPQSVEEPVGAGGSPARFGSDRILDELRRLGCRYLPMNPGSSWRGLHDSVVNHGANREPQLLLCHHEGIAVALAHGYAKATRRPGFAAVHDLVGLMQATMGVYNALVDEVPLVLVGGGGPADTRERRPIDWIHTASAQGELVRNYTKWAAEPVDLPGTEQALAQAARLSTTTPRGPTYVTVDAAVQEQPVGGAEPALPVERTASPGFTLDAGVAVEVVGALRSAAFPVIAVGPMGYDPAATEAVVALAREVGAACIDVDHAAVVPTDEPLNLTGDPEVVADADLILALGVRDLHNLVGEVKGRREGEVVSAGHPDARLIDVGLRDLLVRSWSQMSAFTPECERRALAEPIAAAQTLAAAARDHVPAGDEPGRREERSERVRARHDAVQAATRETLAARWADVPIAPGRLAAELWEAVRSTPWVLTMRNTRSFPQGVWKFRDAGDYLGHSGGAGVGYGPGAAVGAALAALEAGRLAVGIIGDGDFLNGPGALWTAAHYRIPMLLVINDNNSFYNDEGHQEAVALDRGWPVDNAWIGMRMTDPAADLAALAASYGAWSHGPVDDPAQLAGSFQEAVQAAQAGNTAVVHVRTAPQ